MNGSVSTAARVVCNVPEGKVFLGLRGDGGAVGCAHYKVGVQPFTGECEPSEHGTHTKPAPFAVRLYVPASHSARPCSNRWPHH